LEEYYVIRKPEMTAKAEYSERIAESPIARWFDLPHVWREAAFVVVFGGLLHLSAKAVEKAIGYGFDYVSATSTAAAAKAWSLLLEWVGLAVLLALLTGGAAVRLGRLIRDLTRARARFEDSSSARAIDALIMGLSRPTDPGGKRSAILIQQNREVVGGLIEKDVTGRLAAAMATGAAGAPEKGDVVDAFRHQWVQNIRAIHQWSEIPKRIYIVASAGADGSATMIEAFLAFMRAFFPEEPREIFVVGYPISESGAIIEVHKVEDKKKPPEVGISYDAYDECLAAMTAALSHLDPDARRGHPTRLACIDTTAGTKPFSIAQAIASLNGDTLVSYVDTNTGRLLVRDARLDPAIFLPKG
jgi:hypothetical protein